MIPLGIALGIGALGAGVSAISSQRRFRGFGPMEEGIASFDPLMDEITENIGMIDQSHAMLSDPQYGLSNFRNMAFDSAPSQSDMMGLAARTGGSMGAAMGMSRGARLDAGDSALRNYAGYRSNLDSLATNLLGMRSQNLGMKESVLNSQNQMRTNMVGMKMGDFDARRQGMMSLGNNIAGMGFGTAGNIMGQRSWWNNYNAQTG